jgi:hypothetical protein
MKQSREFKESMDRLDKRFRAVVSVPKEAVEKRKQRNGLRTAGSERERKPPRNAD